MSKDIRRREERSQRSPSLQGVHADSIQQVHAVEMYAGPLPHPELLRAFDEIVPNGAARIFEQFEEQSKHRRVMEAKVISSGAFSQRIGSITASLIGFVGVGGGVWLTHEGKSLAGLSTLVVVIGSLVSTYRYQKQQQNKELDNKQAQLAKKK